MKVKLKVLHITSNYPCEDFLDGSKNIKSLIDAIGNRVTSNYALIPTRTKRKYLIDNNVEVLRLYHLPLSVFFSYKYYTSRKKASQIRLHDDFDVIHAHTFVTDGIIAEKLADKHNGRLFLSINNTDINLYLKYRKDLFWLYRRLSLKAKNIFVPSSAYKHRAENILKKIVGETDATLEKIVVIPRAIDDYWFDRSRLVETDTELGNKFRILTVARFEKNKGILNSIKAVTCCLNNGMDLEYHLVGTGSIYAEYKEKYECSSVIFHGKIERLDELCKLYRTSHLFLLNSFSETFGLVYAEALSQGVPVIHSKTEGIDGYFDDKEVAFPVDPRNIKEIVAAISFYYSRRFLLKPRIAQKCMNSASTFRRDIIVNKVISYYQN